MRSKSKVLRRIGAELIWAEVKNENDLIRACKEADGLLNQYALITRTVIENLPLCRVIARYGVGLDSLDLQAATELAHLP